MKYKLSEIMDLIGGGTPKTSKAEYWDGDIPWLSVKDFNDDFRYVYKTEKHITQLGLENSSTKLLQPGDIIISARGTVGELATIPFPMAFNQSCYGLRAKKEIVNEDFLYYLIKHNVYVLKRNTHGSVFDTITRGTFEGIEVDIPALDVQARIAGVLSDLDKKIELNSRINENLEQQLRSVFMELFSDKIANVEANNHRPLGELVINIDNRGKTPPLETTPTEYPIIDVRALSGTSRIVNYANCTKFVSAETYSSWFRSGHPKPKDILVSTVGSLAEIKIFLGSKGCIAQNVVGFRTKDISPYYLYQYLTAIKNDLVAYNIGSVQPSIKVTHIIKHPIYIPSTEELETFDALSESATNAIYNNTLESERLAGIRDALMPKLMSGEIDLSEVQF